MTMIDGLNMDKLYQTVQSVPVPTSNLSLSSATATASTSTSNNNHLANPNSEGRGIERDIVDDVVDIEEEAGITEQDTESVDLNCKGKAMCIIIMITSVINLIAVATYYYIPLPYTFYYRLVLMVVTIILCSIMVCGCKQKCRCCCIEDNLKPRAKILAIATLFFSSIIVIIDIFAITILYDYHIYWILQIIFAICFVVCASLLTVFTFKRG